MKRLMFILIAPLFVLGCGEEPTIERYEVSKPVGYDWPDTALREAEVEVDGLSWVWEVPPGWIDAPEVPDRLLADYRFKGSTESLPGRMTVSKIDGDAGGVNANVFRWLQQIYITNVTGPGPKDKISEPMNIGVGEATFIELHGQYQGEHMPTRIAAAIVQIPAEGGGVYQTWFFKLAGDDATLEANRTGMAQMVLTFRPKGVPRPVLPGLETIDEGGGEVPEQATDES
ncbi:MAG: hypothetical protein KTR15_14230 [Phycisphaeraceae bacterium]|nr:hypothetical protein [Phycisphaeraceae bacterium]